jgi:hypothetical protein
MNKIIYEVLYQHWDVMPIIRTMNPSKEKLEYATETFWRFKSKKDWSIQTQLKNRNDLKLDYQGYVPFVVVTISFSFPLPWLFTRKVTRRVPIMEQELIAIPEHLRSFLFFSWVEKRWKRKGGRCSDHDKRNVSAIIYDTDIAEG